MAADTATSPSVTLAAVARAARLPVANVIKRLYDDHAIETVQDLQDVLAHADAAKTIPALWRVRLDEAIHQLMAADQASTQTTTASVEWRPNGNGTMPRIVVLQGDLTTCSADAIVNAANSQLAHGGGLAGAIAMRGGRAINDESQAWIRKHRSLAVGKAMVTSSGTLPCRFVIHTVGPTIAGSGAGIPTPSQAHQLRTAVWSVLCEAEKRGLATIAIPGISSGIFGYPRDLAAREILQECTRFCRTKHATTTLTTIALVNHDGPTCQSFVKALRQAASDAMESFQGDPFEKPSSVRTPLTPSPRPLPPHKASGVLVARVGKRDFEVLVGVEMRVLDKTPGRRVNFLGGCVDHDTAGHEETPMSTACREFSEEVGGLLTVNQVQRAMEQSSRAVYLAFAKYTMFVVHLDTNRTRSLPELYEKAKKKTKSMFHRRAGAGAEHDHIMWVPWRELVAAATSAASAVAVLPTKHRLSRRRGCYQLRLVPSQCRISSAKQSQRL